MSTGRQGGSRILLLAGTIVLALLGAIRLSRSLFDSPDGWRKAAVAPAAADAADAGAAAEAGIYHVVSSQGEVQVFRAGQWIPIQRNDRLTRDDFVRTSAGAHAVLRVSAGTEVELREKVEIRLDRLSAAGATVDLRRGKVVARVATSDALAITARETRTSNEGPAHFVVLADDHGQVSVASIKGATRFAAAGKTVTVKEGTETRSRPGQPPDDPERIPEEVLLQVVWPTGEKHGDTTAVQGRVAPAAMVMVNGSPAAVGADGHFSAEVPLKEGSNVLEVDTEDLEGRTRSASATIVKRPARPPKLAPEPAELWKKP